MRWGLGTSCLFYRAIMQTARLIDEDEESEARRGGREDAVGVPLLLRVSLACLCRALHLCQFSTWRTHTYIYKGSAVVALLLQQPAAQYRLHEVTSPSSVQRPALARLRRGRAHWQHRANKQAQTGRGAAYSIILAVKEQRAVTEGSAVSTAGSTPRARTSRQPASRACTASLRHTSADPPYSRHFRQL